MNAVSWRPDYGRTGESHCWSAPAACDGAALDNITGTGPARLYTAAALAEINIEYVQSVIGAMACLTGLVDAFCRDAIDAALGGVAEAQRLMGLAA